MTYFFIRANVFFFAAFLLLTLNGCDGTLTGVMDDRTAIGVRDTAAQDGFPAKTIECKVMETCDNLAWRLCPRGFDIVRSIAQKNDGSFTATVRCKQ